MSSISFSGSGINVQGIVSDLMQIERQRLLAIQRAESKEKAIQGAWTDIKRLVEELRTRNDALLNPLLYGSKSPSVTGESVSATATESAATGTYEVVVHQLATNHTLASRTVASIDAPLQQSGSIHIAGIRITFSASDTYQQLADKINEAAGDRVRASWLQTGTGYRLTLTSQMSGSAGAITLVDGGEGALIARSADETVASLAGLEAALLTPGSHEVTVSQLASRHVLAGDLLSAGQTFSGTLSVGGKDLEVSDLTLSQIAAAITDLDAGVRASIERAGSGRQRLVLASTVDGASGAILIGPGDGLAAALGLVDSLGQLKHERTRAQDAVYTVDGAAYTAPRNDGVPTGIPGVSLQLHELGTTTISVGESQGLAVELGLLDSSGAIRYELVSAQDASFSVNGLSMTRSGNQVSDVSPGLTLNLQAEGSATVTVSADTGKVEKAVDEWVSAYNALRDALRRYTARGDNGLANGVLFGNSLAAQLDRHMRSLVGAVVSGLPAREQQLSFFGISHGAFGSADYNRLALDTARLKERLAEDPSALGRIFGALSPDGAEVMGIATQMQSWLRGVAGGADSMIDNRLTVSRDNLKLVAEQIERENARLARRETQLRATYTQLDQTLVSLRAQQQSILGMLSYLPQTFF